jgi:hypothetical protein
MYSITPNLYIHKQFTFEVSDTSRMIQVKENGCYTLSLMLACPKPNPMAVRQLISSFIQKKENPA